MVSIKKLYPDFMLPYKSNLSVIIIILIELTDIQSYRKFFVLNQENSKGWDTKWLANMKTIFFFKLLKLREYDVNKTKKN